MDQTVSLGLTINLFPETSGFGAEVCEQVREGVIGYIRSKCGGSTAS